jgi:hypothetical protein
MTYVRTDQAYSRGCVNDKYLGDFGFESRPEELSWLNFYVVFLRHYKWVLRQYLKLGPNDIFHCSLQCTEDSTTERHVAIAHGFVKYITNSFSFTLEHTLLQQPILRKTIWRSGSHWLESGKPEFDFQKGQGFFPHSSPYLSWICENLLLYPSGVYLITILCRCHEIWES